MLFFSYNYIPTGMATTLHFCYPAMVIVFSIVFLREKVRPLKLLCVAMCLAGMFMFYDVGGNISLTGIFLAFISGNTYAFYILYLDKSELKEIHSLKLIFYMNTVAAVLIGAVALAKGQMILPFSAAGWAAATAFAVCVSFIAVLGFQIGVKVYRRAERSYIEYTGAYNQRDGWDHSLRRELFCQGRSRLRPHIGGDGHSGYDKRGWGERTVFRSGVKRKQCQKITRWAGGRTRQLAIYPQDAQGAEAFDFVFEITSSTTDIKESEYTIYESYNRTLMIISGESALTLEDGDSHSLSPYEQCTFDGALKVLSRGRAVDYEMTLRKGRSGRVEFLGRVSDLSIKEDPGYLGLYCLKGSLRIYSKDGEHLLYEGDQFSAFSDETKELRLEGEALVIQTIIDL